MALATTATAQNVLDLFTQVEKNGEGRLFMAVPAIGQTINEAVAVTLVEQMLGYNYSIKPERTQRDGLGFTHVRYTVFNGEWPLAQRRVIAHFRDGRLTALNGDLELPASPEGGAFTLTEQQALDAALAKVNASAYKWQNPAEEQHMRKVLNDPSFTYYPHGKKVWLVKDNQLQPAWQFNIYAETPLYKADVYVHAATGAVLEEQNQICSVNVPVSANTKYSGVQSFTCDSVATGQYRLRQTTSGGGVETYDMNNGTSYNAATDFTNASVTWTMTSADQGALDAHWGAERTYDYYWTTFARNSIDDNGKKLLSYVHYGNGFNNAFWDGNRMTYGDGGGGTTIYTALDICGHEVTHGVTEWSANLNYSYESGALNESFSDIFGTAIEQFARPSNWNWKIGEDIYVNKIGMRNMANPNQFGDPDTYKGSNWWGSAGDNGGVHTNSGVPNYWFYLLVMGGNGTNDLNDAYSVQALGMNNASKIAYRALTQYFTQTTDFAAARAACIQAAKDLFGDCSHEMIQTANAWHAVGVGLQITANAIQPGFNAIVQSFCSLPASVSFSNTTPYASAYTWSFGDGASSSALNPVHTYTAAGNYVVSLKASGCLGQDSIVKAAFISVDLPQAPSVTGNTVCYGNMANLVANANGELQWFTSPTSTLASYTGSIHTIQSLTTTETWFVNNSYTAAPATGGILYPANGGHLTNNAHYLIFDVHQNSTLNTVIVHAKAAGSRIIELRNSANFVIESKTVALVANINTVTLNFKLAIGSGYRLGLANNSTADLFRSNGGVSYPYPVGNVVTINGSSAGSGAYYWFYQWNVTREKCSSPLTSVVASVMPVPQVFVSASSSVVCVGDLVPLTLFPAGGVLSGSGVQGTSFNALAAGAGTHTVSYYYSNENDCADSENFVIIAEECNGLAEGPGNEMRLFPNPSLERVTITGLPAASQVSVFDHSGRLVLKTGSAQNDLYMDVGHLARGLYMVLITSENGQQEAALRLLKE